MIITTRYTSTFTAYLFCYIGMVINATIMYSVIVAIIAAGIVAAAKWVTIRFVNTDIAFTTIIGLLKELLIK